MLRWCCLASLALACSSGNPELLVDVTSDLAAVTELTSVEISLSRGTTLVTGVDYAFVPADNLSDGVRVAELRAPNDNYVLRVRAFDPVGDLIAEEVRDIRLTSRFGVTVFIDGACVDVTCPAEGDPRTFTACMGGSCVPPACIDDPSLCDVDAGEDAGVDATTDVPVDTPVDTNSSDTGADGSTCALPMVMGTFQIVAVPDVREEGGVDVVEGADIDERVSDSADEVGCFINDRVDPDGTPGIDNQLASLIPTIASLTSEELNAILTMADVTFMLRTDATMGGMCDAVILRTATDEFRAPGVLRDGTIRARFGGGSMMNIPWFTDEGLTLQDLSVRIDTMSGVVFVAGRLSIDELVDSFLAVGGGMAPEDTIRSVLESVADLDNDAMGVCQSLSASVEAR